MLLVVVASVVVMAGATVAVKEGVVRAVAMVGERAAVRAVVEKGPLEQ